MADEVYEHLTFDARARPDRTAARAWPSAPSPSRRRARRSRFTGWKVGWAYRAGPRWSPRCARPSSSSPTWPAARSSRRWRSASRCPTSTSTSFTEDLQRKRDRLCAGLERGRLRGVPPAGHVLHHAPTSGSVGEERRHGVLPVACPSGAASWPCPTSSSTTTWRRGRAAGALRVLQAHEVLDEAVARLQGSASEEVGMRIAAIQHDIVLGGQRGDPPPRRAHGRGRGGVGRRAGRADRDVRHRLLDGGRAHRRARGGPTSTCPGEQAARPRRLAVRLGRRAADPAVASPVNSAVLAGPDGDRAPLRQDPPLHLRRRARALRRRRRGTVTVEIGGLRVSLFVCYDLRFADELVAAGPDHRLYLVLRQLARGPAGPLAALLQARAIENQAYVVGRQPGRRGRRR